MNTRLQIRASIHLLHDLMPTKTIHHLNTVQWPSACILNTLICDHPRHSTISLSFQGAREIGSRNHTQRPLGSRVRGNGEGPFIRLSFVSNSLTQPDQPQSRITRQLRASTALAAISVCEHASHDTISKQSAAPSVDAAAAASAGAAAASAGAAAAGEGQPVAREGSRPSYRAVAGLCDIPVIWSAPSLGV
jgi:hypothetical protein